jgi:hypothetical protein
VSQQTTNRSFDDLARGLANGTLSRRKALRLMGGILVGGALASVPGVALADDDCRRFGRRCRRDSQCCSKNCVRRGDDKVCGCPEGKTRCGGRCVTHCAGGGRPNPDTCECGCPSGQVLCNGSCVSNQCGTGQTFDSSTCQCLSACPDQPCCCSCVYRDATGALVSTCVSPYAGDVVTCNTLCNAQTPPGTTFVDREFICSIVADAVPVCAPASTGTGTTCGANAPCASPPA